MQLSFHMDGPFNLCPLLMDFLKKDLFIHLREREREGMSRGRREGEGEGKGERKSLERLPGECGARHGTPSQDPEVMT